MNVRDALGISEKRQEQLSRVLQLSLVGLLFIGVDRGNMGIAVNATVALAVTYLPALLEREYDVPMDAGLTLWITVAVFLHALGTVGIPGSRYSFYANVWWWDHMTHALSSSVVAAAGYTVARAVDEHSDAVYLPSRFMFVFILLFVLAFGVFWEVIEFAVSGLASVLGSGSVLTQYGLSDTMLDLVFDAIGGVVVAVWGTAHLTDVAGALTEKLDERSGDA
ncbi:hypothetical protein [Halobaculum sp. D14]|uniref:hypothetical protein n=1 Tax=unclassified Halobaculum TaxID=2640896 RepID=UPI003EB920C4